MFASVFSVYYNNTWLVTKQENKLLHCEEAAGSRNNLKHHVSHTLNNTHLRTDARRYCWKNVFLELSTHCTAAVFNAGTLKLLSQVGCRGQGVALKPLQQHKHPIDNCHLKAAQSDWLHAWWQIILCSCTLMRACTTMAQTHTQYTHTKSLSRWYRHTYVVYVQTHRLSFLRGIKRTWAAISYFLVWL